MAAPPIKLKRSGTTTATPSSLEYGEIAINYADGVIFYRDSSDVIQSFTLQAYALSSHTHAASDITSGTLDAARLPLATTGAVGGVIVGTGLGVSGGTVSVTYGTTAGTACQGNDARLSDTRTPTDGSVTTAKIADDAVTYAKLQNVSTTDRLLGRSSAGAGDVEEITCTAFGRSVISSADAAAGRTALSVQPTASPAFTGAPSLINSGASDNSTIRYGNGGKNWYVGLRGDTSNVFAITDDSSFRLTISTTGVSTFSGSVVVNNDGNVVPLTVTNTGTANSFVVNDASGDTSPFVIDASGNVGIGTSSPSTYGLFVISGGSAAISPTLTIESTAFNAGQGCAIDFARSGFTQKTQVRLATEDNGASGSSFVISLKQDGDAGALTERLRINSTGQLLVTAGSGTGPSSYKPGIAVSGDDDTGVQQIGGANTLSLVTGGSERVRVDASGRVGVGVTPASAGSSALQVRGDLDIFGNGADRSITYNVGVGDDGITGWYRAKIAFVPSGAANNVSQHIAFFNKDGDAGGSTLTERARITAAGEVLIGTTTDNGAYLLQVNSQIYATNATIATSDARFKTNVESLTDATAVIEALRPVAFDFIAHEERNFATERQVGLIAQEAQSALAGTDYADSVVAQCGDHLGLAYEKLVPVLVKALQESNARIAALEERLNHA